MMIQKLRKIHPLEEFDYPFLMNFLSEYKKPRDKISRLLKNQEIIRVKKGLYVFGPEYRKGPICLETLANLIYGPSYISLEYALSFYGLIPERVERITSMTTEKDKTFHTPVGVFSYKHLFLPHYSVGVTIHHLDEYHSCLMASKEKALADVLAHSHYKSIQSLQELFKTLTEELRIEESEIFALNRPRLHRIANTYQNRVVDLLDTLVRNGHA